MISIDCASIALVFFCIVQLVITLQRLIFDFLGFQYALIIFNFLNLIFDLFGIFGSFQRRIVFIICCVVWSFIYIAFNLFVICFYLEIGSLNRENSWVLSLVDSERTWWFGNLCGPIVLSNQVTQTNSTISSLSPLAKTTTEVIIPRSDQVSIDCVFPYYYVEVLQACIQILLSFCSFICAVTAATRLHNLKDILDIHSGPNVFDSRGERFTFEQPELYKNRQPGYRGSHNRGTVVDALSVESFRPDSREGVMSVRQNYVPPIPANSRPLSGMVPVDLSADSLNDRRPLMTSNPPNLGFTSSAWIPQINEPTMQYQISPHTTATSATVRSVDSFRMAISGPEQVPTSSSHPVAESIPLRSLTQHGNGNAAFMYEPAQQSSFVSLMSNNNYNNARPSPYVFIPPAR